MSQWFGVWLQTNLLVNDAYGGIGGQHIAVLHHSSLRQFTFHNPRRTAAAFTFALMCETRRAAELEIT
jgi:hypothetical protein